MLTRSRGTTAIDNHKHTNLPSGHSSNCQLCQLPHRKCVRVRHYDIVLCPDCQMANADGWQSAYEPQLLAGLRNNGLLIPDRTADGLLPFCYAPPSDYAL